MIIRYHQLDTDVRDLVRALEKKGHIPYIRYLFLNRTPIEHFDVELTRLGLSSGTEEQYIAYFEHVLYPVIGRFKLTRYYKKYLYSQKDERLRFAHTFEQDDIARENFCKLANETETILFFNPDIINYYGKTKIPLGDDGEPIVDISVKADWTDVLLHDKRHLIDGMLSDGHSPQSISKHLDEAYDIDLNSLVISYYGKSFMNVQRKGMEDVIEEVMNERGLIEQQLKYVKANTDLFTIGERVSAVSTLRGKLDQLDDQLKRLHGAHSNASYSQGVIEYSDMREIFADVMLRTHRRYKRIDARTEDSVIEPLSKMVNMMAKATDKMITLDVAMQDNTKKTISEEMIEVVLPTLERVEEEEKEAREQYMASFGIFGENDDDDDDEILGDDE